MWWLIHTVGTAVLCSSEAEVPGSIPASPTVTRGAAGSPYWNTVKISSVDSTTSSLYSKNLLRDVTVLTYLLIAGWTV